MRNIVEIIFYASFLKLKALQPFGFFLNHPRMGYKKNEVSASLFDKLSFG